MAEPVPLNAGQVVQQNPGPARAGVFFRPVT